MSLSGLDYDMFEKYEKIDGERLDELNKMIIDMKKSLSDVANDSYYRIKRRKMKNYSLSLVRVFC